MTQGQGWKNPNTKHKKPRSKKRCVPPKKQERREKEKDRERGQGRPNER